MSIVDWKLMISLLNFIIFGTLFCVFGTKNAVFGTKIAKKFASSKKK